MSNYRQKFENYQRALERLQEGIGKFEPDNDLQRDGLIQRFEFTFELAWKTLKNIFEDEGLSGLNSPKTVLKEAFAARLITDEEIWLTMLSDRNTTAHIYNEQLAVEICNRIIKDYTHEFTALQEKMKLRINA